MLLQVPGLRDIIRVEEGDELSAGCLDASTARRRGSKVRLPDNAHQWREAFDAISGVVRRSVVDHHNFVRLIELLAKERPDRPPDDVGAIVNGHDHGDQRR